MASKGERKIIMDISAITAPSTTTTTGSSSSNAALSLNDFYKLLAAEMQYQDPSSDSSSSGSSSNSYITELATLSEATAVQNLTKVTNYVMAAGLAGKTVGYTSTATSATGTTTSTTKTGVVEAVDFTADTPRCYVATTSNGTTTGSWVDYATVTKVYASDVTDSSSTSTSTSSSTTKV